MKFKVTKEDIENGRQQDPEHNPLALALAREMGLQAGEVECNQHYVMIDWIEYDTTPQMLKFWRTYEGWPNGWPRRSCGGPACVRPAEFEFNFVK